MTNRRAMIIGGASLAAAAAAYALTPRRQYNLVGDSRLADLVPLNIPAWRGRDVSDLIAPPAEGSLEARLYQETVERIYQNEQTGAEVMVLLAHGAAQTNQLQLHRPEVCYPAFGFRLSGSRAVAIPISGDVAVPGRALVAEAADRREAILYWTRLGDYLPVDGAEQRVDRVRLALQGLVADGVLSRISAVGPDAAANGAMVVDFARRLLIATPSAGRRALIGSALAGALTSAA